eukprot:02395_5
MNQRSRNHSPVHSQSRVAVPSLCDDLAAGGRSAMHAQNSTGSAASLALHHHQHPHQSLHPFPSHALPVYVCFPVLLLFVCHLQYLCAANCPPSRSGMPSDQRWRPAYTVSPSSGSDSAEPRDLLHSSAGCAPYRAPSQKAVAGPQVSRQWWVLPMLTRRRLPSVSFLHHHPLPPPSLLGLFPAFLPFSSLTATPGFHEPPSCRAPVRLTRCYCNKRRLGFGCEYPTNSSNSERQLMVYHRECARSDIWHCCNHHRHHQRLVVG